MMELANLIIWQILRSTNNCEKSSGRILFFLAKSSLPLIELLAHTTANLYEKYQDCNWKHAVT
jgi:hypothetical protein